MKRLLAIISVLFLVPGVASAVVIDFDSLPVGNIDGVNLGGVTITSGDGSTQVINNGGVGSVSPPNAVTNNGFTRNNPLILTFDSLQNSVTVTGGDRGGDRDQFVLRAFNNANMLLGTVMTPVFGGNPIAANFMTDNFTQTISFAGMRRVEVESIINAGIGIDDLTFGEAPAPATLSLLALGLVALRSRRRRSLL